MAEIRESARMQQTSITTNAAREKGQISEEKQSRCECGKIANVSHRCDPDNASAATTAQIKIGTRVEMTSENSNWEVGEKGTVVWVGDDCVAIEFDSREDDYTAFLDAFKSI